MTTPLEDEVAKLVLWCETNTADSTDLREALTAAGILLGKRCDAARQDELDMIQEARTATLATSGRAVLMAAPITEVATPLQEGAVELSKTPPQGLVSPG